VNKILKFIYHNQEFASIKSELNEENISQLLSQAHMMECWHLKDHLDEFLINEILTPENVTHHYLDSISFGSDKMKKACEQMIFQYFGDIIDSEDGKRFLMKLPWHRLNTILTSDKLNIKEEKVLIQLIESFMDHRKDLPIPKEDNMKVTYTDNLTEKELEERDKLNKEEEKKKEDEKLAKEKEEADKRNALTTEEAKIDFDMRKEVDILHK